MSNEKVLGKDCKIHINICWGHFDALGGWWPNYCLKMPVAEQRRQNIENGHMTDDGKRIPLPNKIDWWQN